MSLTGRFIYFSRRNGALNKFTQSHDLPLGLSLNMVDDFMPPTKNSSEIALKWFNIGLFPRSQGSSFTRCLSISKDKTAL